MNYDTAKLRALFGAAMNAQKDYTQNDCQPKAWKTDEQSGKVARAYIKVIEDIDTYLKVGEPTT